MNLCNTLKERTHPTDLLETREITDGKRCFLICVHFGEVLQSLEEMEIDRRGIQIDRLELERIDSNSNVGEDSRRWLEEHRSCSHSNSGRCCSVDNRQRSRNEDQHPSIVDLRDSIVLRVYSMTLTRQSTSGLNSAEKRNLSVGIDQRSERRILSDQDTNDVFMTGQFSRDVHFDREE